MPNPPRHLPQHPTDCPMDSLLRLLMGPWTTYILWVLHSDGPTRFGALKRRVTGISAKMLTERLRMLEEAGVVSRHHQPSVPPQVTYSLTERGQELRRVLDELSALARRWQETDVLAASRPATAAPAAATHTAPAAAAVAETDPLADGQGADRPGADGPAAADRRYVDAAE